MKIRKGFVTNSSSSSFIIDKYDTVESTFEIIKGLYIECKNKFEEMNEYCLSMKDKQYPQLNKEDKQWEFRFKDGMELKKRHAIDDLLYTEYGITSWDYINIEEVNKIISASSYKEYLEIFKDKAPYDYPFQIEIFNDINDKSYKDDIIEWYSDKEDSYMSKYYLGTPKQVRKLLQNKVIVSSECGNIPSYIVEKLGDLCINFCNHMG